MAWEFDELVRVHVEVLALSSAEEQWDRVEATLWLRHQIERDTYADKQREFRSRQHGRLYHSNYERTRRKRNKERAAVVRCCEVCRGMFTLTATQHADGTRFCSLRCAARYRIRRHQPRPTRMVTIGKATRSLPEWAAHYGIGVSMVYRRMREGMSEVEALTTPKARRSA